MLLFKIPIELPSMMTNTPGRSSKEQLPKRYEHKNEYKNTYPNGKSHNNRFVLNFSGLFAPSSNRLVWISWTIFYSISFIFFFFFRKFLSSDVWLFS